MNERATDYQNEHDDYGSGEDRCPIHAFNSPEQIARQMLNACGAGSVLDVGSGMGLLVQTLLAAGVDTRGIDVAWRAVQSCNDRLPGRFEQASVLDLPFPGGSFDTLISTHCLEHIAPQDIPKVLREMARVTRRNLFLRVVTTVDGDRGLRLTIQKRDWWEQRLFEAGFRKHPNSFRINSYEGLEHETGQITIVMEKIPPEAFGRYPNPLPSVSPVNELPADMLRITGRDSDAQFARYHLASRCIRPGDTVLEIGAGSAAGLHVLRNNCPARRLIALQRSVGAVEYGRANFGDESPAIEFRAGEARAALAAWPDHSIDSVIVFDILDHDHDPLSLLREISRVLIPGGRVILSAARASVAAAGDGHALTFDKLQNLLGSCLLKENLYQQHADPVSGARSDSGSAGRWLRQLSGPPDPNSAGQWWIATAIKDPLAGVTVPYRETVFANLLLAEHPSTQYARWYRNPWVVHSMVHVGYRVKSSPLLMKLAARLLDESPLDSADYGAALCILAYQLVSEITWPHAAIESLISKILPYLELPFDNPHVYRWRISLTFVVGQLELKTGCIDQARRYFRACSAMDPFRFSVHLATKTAESFFLAGWLALNQGDRAEAGQIWKSAMELGDRLLARRMDDVLMNPADPNIFDHGDGMREFVHAIESIGKCVNGIHLLMREREGRRVDWGDVQNTFRGKSEQLSQDLRDAQSQAIVLTGELVNTRAELLTRTVEVDRARADLITRTADLDVARQDLNARTSELDVARQNLISRTTEADIVRQELIARTAELNAVRQDLISRTAELDAARQDLISRTAELDADRRELISRTAELDVARQDLISRTAELDTARQWWWNRKKR